mgnify:CR=1 FL=1
MNKRIKHNIISSKIKLQLLVLELIMKETPLQMIIFMIEDFSEDNEKTKYMKPTQVCLDLVPDGF